MILLLLRILWSNFRLGSIGDIAMKKGILFLLALIVGDIHAEDFYMGTEIHHRHLAFKYDSPVMETNIVPRNHTTDTYHASPQPSMVIGYKLTPHFSIEGGAHRSQTKGMTMTTTRHHLRGTYVTLIAFRDICGIKFLIGGGIANLKSVFKNSTVRKFHYKKTVPRFVVGFQFDPHENTTLRFTYVSEQASRLRHKNPGVDITPRDSFAFGTGFFYNF